MDSSTHPNRTDFCYPIFKPAKSSDIRAAARTSKVEREKVALAALPDLAIRILDYTRDHGRVTMSNMILTTGASRNTLKEHFRSLVEKKLLVQQGGGRSTWYTLP